MPELVMPVEELGLRIWDMVFLVVVVVVDDGRCCGSVFIKLVTTGSCPLECSVTF
jgi:hypothetical protein